MVVTMAISQQVTAQDVGLRLADEARQDPVAQGVWARAVRDYIELWLLTEPIDAETERHFYGLSASLDRWFPETYIQFYLVNPRLFSEDTELVGDVIPSTAVSIWRRS
jgi:hypothetical protein